MTFTAFVALAFKRLTSRLGLTLMLILSIALAIGVMVTVPVFSGAVSRKIMVEEFSAKQEQSTRPLFPVRFYAQPTAGHSMTLEDAAYARDWIGTLLSERTKLPISLVYMENASPFFQLRPRADDPNYDREYLDAAKVAYVQDLADHVTVYSGDPYGTISDSDILTVWVEKYFADSLALQVNERYVLGNLYSTAGNQLPVKVAGFFEANDTKDPFWHTVPSWHFDGVLLTTPEQYERWVYPWFEERTGYHIWYYILDDTKMNLNQAPHYVWSLQETAKDVAERLPGGGMDTAPTGGLVRGQNRKTALSLILLGFSVPLIGILIYFIGSVSSMLARTQGQEIAMLASRGSSRMQILGIMLLETLVLLVFSLPLGIGFGMGVAKLMGYSLSFMSFVHRAPLEVHLASIDWRLVGAACLFSLLARLVPSWLAARFNVVSHAQRTGRGQTMMTATRILFMVLGGFVTYYAYRQLSVKGSLGMISWNVNDPTNDPLLLLAPSLFVFVAPLFAAELFVLLMRPLALIGRFVPSITTYMGGLNLGREGGQYRTPIYMLVLCITLGVFYASLATSADIWSVDQRRYETGADITFTFPVPEDSSSSSSVFGGSSQAADTMFEGVATLPMSDYEAIPGVEMAMPVGEYQARFPMGRTMPKTRLLAVDRTRFSQVAYYRRDYSWASLGELMNRLGATEDGILMPSTLMSQWQLSVGDIIGLNFSTDGNAWYPFEFKVAGSFDYFPTMYESQAPVAVVNLEYLQMQTGGSLPYGIWLDLAPDADAEETLAAVQALKVAPKDPVILQDLLTLDQNRLERVGVFGMLSVCFLAGALLSGLGLLVYSFLSMTRRALGFAVLQAIGLKRGEVMRIVSVEYLVTLLFGLLVGVVLGIIASQLYVPLFPITDAPGLPIPPFVPYVDWSKAGWIIVAMGFTLVLVEVVILLRIARTRVFEALRLGTRE